MRVLEHHQDGAAARHRFELAEQRLEQLFAFALRAEVQVRRGVRQRQQIGDQLDFIAASGTRRK
jgi:hypothetical protein